MPQTKTRIGLVTATIVCLNAMIGSGIFTAPSAVASSVGPAGILTYLFVGLAVWCMALCFARLAYLFPQEGSFYTYTKSWAGHTGGLLAVGSYLVGLTIAMGMLIHVTSFYLHTIFPTMSTYLLGLSALVTLVLLNLFGVTLSALGQKILLFCTLFPLTAITSLCLWHAKLSNLHPFAPYGFSNVFAATRIVIFGFLGFECASSLFGIVENAQKNVPRALSYSILIIAGLYTLFVGSIIMAVPLTLLQDPRVPFSVALKIAFPGYGWFINGIHYAILSAILGTLHSMIWSASTLLHTVIHKITFAHKALVNIRHSQQHGLMVMIIGVAIATNFSLFSNLSLFFSMSSILIVSALCLSMIALLFIRRDWRCGRNIITLIGLATAGVILYYAAKDLLAAASNLG